MCVKRVWCVGVCGEGGERVCGERICGKGVL